MNLVDDKYLLQPPYSLIPIRKSGYAAAKPYPKIQLNSQDYYYTSHHNDSRLYNPLKIQAAILIPSRCGKDVRIFSMRAEYLTFFDIFNRDYLHALLTH